MNFLSQSHCTLSNEQEAIRARALLALRDKNLRYIIDYTRCVWQREEYLLRAVTVRRIMRYIGVCARGEFRRSG